MTCDPRPSLMNLDGQPVMPVDIVGDLPQVANGVNGQHTPDEVGQLRF